MGLAATATAHGRTWVQNIEAVPRRAPQAMGSKGSQCTCLPHSGSLAPKLAYVFL